MRNKNSMTQRDLPVLRAAGFKAGFSGQTWFGVDKYGTLWQTQVLDDNEHLDFKHVHESTKWGGTTMSREEFTELFEQSLNSPAARAGD